MSDALDSICVSLSSRDFENYIFLVTMIQIEIFNVFGHWECVFLVFVGALPGPDPRRAQGTAQGRAQGRAQGPGEGPGESPTRAQRPQSA